MSLLLTLQFFKRISSVSVKIFERTFAGWQRVMMTVTRSGASTRHRFSSLPYALNHTSNKTLKT